eukprot:5479751-Amphidinium_carterae.2
MSSAYKNALHARTEVLTEQILNEVWQSMQKTSPAVSNSRSISSMATDMYKEKNQGDKVQPWRTPVAMLLKV